MTPIAVDRDASPGRQLIGFSPAVMAAVCSDNLRPCVQSTPAHLLVHLPSHCAKCSWLVHILHSTDNLYRRVMVSHSIDNPTPHRELAASAMMACGVLLAVKISSSSEQLGPGCTGRGSENKTDLDKGCYDCRQQRSCPPSMLDSGISEHCIALGFGSAAVGPAVWPCCVCMWDEPTTAMVLPVSQERLHDGSCGGLSWSVVGKMQCCDCLVSRACCTLVAYVILSAMSVRPAASHQGKPLMTWTPQSHGAMPLLLDSVRRQCKQHWGQQPVRKGQLPDQFPSLQILSGHNMLTPSFADCLVLLSQILLCRQRAGQDLERAT